MRTDALFESALNHQTLSFVVHADAGAGKTTLCATAPKPLLMGDCEGGGAKWVPGKRVYWNPISERPPENDGSWDICIVTIRKWEDIAYMAQYLVLGDHPFASLCFDSLTGMQNKLQKSLVGTDQMKQQTWGTMLTKMDDLVSDFRDLTEHPTNPLSVVCFITETEMRDDKWRPSLQGAMRNRLPYRVDIVGYLKVNTVPDPMDPEKTVEQRMMWIGPHPQVVAKERVQGRLGNAVISPNVTNMLKMSYDIELPTDGDK